MALAHAVLTIVAIVFLFLFNIAKFSCQMERAA